MKIIGMIAEFNPFHNGHQYILSQARVLTGCDFVVVAMSGDFVQRGAPAIFDKSIRARAALLNGADLVVQLPALVSTGSARDFAYGGIKTLSACGVDTLVFGCECTDLSLIRQLADILYEEPFAFKEALQNSLRNGLNYPSAQTEAFLSCVHTELSSSELRRILREPNTILALEYLRAIRELGVSMDVLPIARVGVSHHDRMTTAEFASATQLRAQLLKNGTRSDFEPFVPANVHTLYAELLSRQPLLSEDDYEKVLPYKLLLSSQEDLQGFLDANVEMIHRINRHLDSYTSFSSFLDTVITKDITRGRILRLFTHILLNLRTDQMGNFKAEELPYVRVLGFTKSLRPHLGQLITDSVIVTSVAAGEKCLSDNSLLASDVFSRNVYLTLARTKADTCSLLTDYRLPVQIL